MSNPKNRDTVEEALRSELERDRTKTYVVEISPLGLVEMTRQNVTDGPREILTTKCAVCAGDGFVVSEATHALEVERKLRELARGSRVQGFSVAVHPRVLSLLAGPGGARLEAIEAASRRRFFLVPAPAENGHLHLDHFEVLKQGKLDALRPRAPFEEGAALELKLVEVGLYDPTAGVGKVDDIEVVVAGAAKLVGKKLAVTVGRVLDGIAFATPSDGAVVPKPITFEAEAEKPTRGATAKKAEAEKPAPASSRRKAAETEVEDSAVAPVLEAEALELEPAAPEQELEVVAPETREEVEAAAGEQPKKKRTRRGTRGGRGRKKSAGAGGEVVETASPKREEGRRTTPRIHVPPADLALAEAPSEQEPALVAPEESTLDADGQPRPKRSRRGSRGGRKRRKPSTNGPATDDVAAGGETEGEEVAVVAPEPRSTGSEPYVPMSEWIEDFERSRGSR
jgi:ribonuclease G